MSETLTLLQQNTPECSRKTSCASMYSDSNIESKVTFIYK